MELGNAKLDVVVDASGARSGVEEAKRAFDILKRQGVDAVSGIGSAFSRLKDMFFSLKGAIAGIGLGLLANSFIQAGKETEGYMVRLRVLLGSVSEGNKLFKEMNDFAARTPFEFREVMGAATQLASVLRGGQKEVTAYMPLIADLAAASGLGIQETTGQVVRMLAAGASAADRFRETGILAMLGFQTGVKYSAEETRKILIQAWEDPSSKFRDAAKLLVNTWEGAMSNLKDAWFQFQQRVMIDGGVLDYLKSIVQVLSGEFTGGFGAATDAADRFARFTIGALENVVKGVGYVIEGVKFIGVAFEAVKVAANGLSNLWANLTEDVALANAEIAKSSALRAEASYESIKDDWFATEKEKLQAKEEYRSALEAQLAAELNLAEKTKELAQNNSDTTASVEALFAAYQSFSEGVDFDEFLDNVKAKYEENRKAGGDAAKSGEAFVSGLMGFVGPAGEAANAVDKMTKAEKEAKKSKEEAKKAQEDWNAELERTLQAYNSVYAAEQRRDQAIRILQSGVMAGKVSGEMYRKVLAEINKEYEEGIKKGDKYGDTVEDIKSKYLTGYAAAKSRNDALKIANDLQSQGKLTGSDYAIVIANINKEFENSAKSAQDSNGAMAAWQKTMENAAQGIQTAFSDFFYNIFDKGVKSFKDLGKSILDVFKRTLAEMAVMAIAKPIIVPIIQGMSGGGGGGWGNIIGSFFGGGQSGGAGGQAGGMNWGSMLGQFFGGGQSGGAGGGFGDILSAGRAGNMLGGGTMNSSAMQSYGVLNTPTGRVPSYGGTIGGYSTMGLMGGVAGAAYGLRRGDGGLGTVGSTAAGAFGGYALGAAGAAGAGALMAGGTAAAAGSAALAAIPVVGWIALAMLAIDKISGGKLFGTKFKTNQVTRELTISEEGGTGQMLYDQSRQRSLFRGTVRRTEIKPIDEETQQAVTSLFQQLMQGQTAVERVLGDKVADLITGSFSQIFDKKGNLTSEFSTVRGVKYNEDQEAFATRLQGENIIEVVRQYSEDASEIAERWRSNAETLLEGASMMLLAQTDINKGFGLLGDEGGLAEVVDLVEDLANSGERLSDAYIRVSQSTSMFDQFIEHLGLTLSNGREEVVSFATAIAEAAGGLDRAQQLYATFQQSYFSDAERREIALRAARTSSQSEVEDLGAAGEGLTFENFRQRFTDILPTLNAEDVVEWLEAGDALATLNQIISEIGEGSTDAVAALSNYSQMYDTFLHQWSNAQMTQTDMMRLSAEALREQAENADSSITSQAQLFGMLQDRYDMEIAYLSMIRDIQQEMNSTIDSSIERIRLSQMDDGEKYDYFRGQANQLAIDMGSMQDPTQIRNAMQRLDSLQQSAWSTLDDEGRTDLAQEFIDFLEGVREVANERLEGAEDEVRTQNEEIASALGVALERFNTEAIAAQTQTQTVVTTLQGAIEANTERQQQIANQQTEASNTMLSAANIIASTQIRVIISDQYRPEIGY